MTLISITSEYIVRYHKITEDIFQLIHPTDSSQRYSISRRTIPQSASMVGNRLRSFEFVHTCQIGDRRHCGR